MGRIGELVAGVRATPTPLERRLDEMGRRLAAAAVAGAALVAALRLLRGERILDVLQTAIAVAIAAVPEGLPAVSTIAMAVGIHRMARRRALIRRLPTVESLGSATVVCTDKTGTLTAGVMRAVALWTPTLAWRETPDGAPPPLDDAIARAALRAGVLANRAPLAPDDASDPTEVALLRLAADAGLDAAAERAAWPEEAELPFSSERMLMATVHREPGGARVAFAKGAPRTILERCARIAGAAGDAPLDERARATVLGANDAMAARGLRVLALAAGAVRGSGDPDIAGLTLLALVGMTDPPAPGVLDALARLHRAGVRTVMLTGDQRGTALAIARELGVASADARALDGREVESLDDAALDAAAPEIGVVSRVSPGAKLRIVAALQRRGEVVAMLGDGVNDAPALRQADVGVAMGGRGSDVAKEAAGVVLQDDRFETVAAAVEEGRRIDENIRRAIFYLVSCNLGELLVIIAAGLLGWPVPLTPLQILWLNLLTDTLPALSLAVAPGAPDLMARPPRPPRAPLFDGRAIRAGLGFAAVIAGGALAAFALALRAEPEALARARTICFLALGLAQVAQLSNVRDHPAGWRAAGRALATPPALAAAVTILLLLATVAVPPLARVMRAAPPTEALGWVTLAALAALPALVGWIARRAGALAHRTRSSPHA
jgi:Ca2+-transporting ATPase